MEKVKLIPLLALILLSASCRIEGEVWVKNSGAGHGVFHVSGIPFLTKADIKDEFSGCDEVIVTDQGNGNYKTEIEWSDFEKVFRTRELNEDKTILLHFGEADENLGTLTVHVNGKIDQSRTSGRLRDSETVVFRIGEEAYLVYEPTSSIWLYLLAAGLTAVVVVIVLAIKRNTLPQKNEP